MNTKRVLFIVVLVALSIGLYFGLRTKWVSKIIVITATSQDIFDYIDKPANIAKWLSPFTDSTKTIVTKNTISYNSDSITIVNSNLIRTEWDYTLNNKREKIYLKILPTDSGVTNLTLFYKDNWITHLFKSNPLVEKIKYLKLFLESPMLLYGIDVKDDKVTDTFLLTTTKNVSKVNLKEEIKKTYAELVSYAAIKNLGYTGTRIIHETRLSATEVALYVGIGISKMYDTKNENNFSFTQMPKGNLLIVNYDGIFGEREKTIAQFMNYAKKLSYQSMALPFEKWVDSGFVFADTQRVKLKICLPVY
jgi:effector-binding domain-containing protein